MIDSSRLLIGIAAILAITVHAIVDSVRIKGWHCIDALVSRLVIGWSAILIVFALFDFRIQEAFLRHGLRPVYLGGLIWSVLLAMVYAWLSVGFEKRVRALRP